MTDPHAPGEKTHRHRQARAPSWMVAGLLLIASVFVLRLAAAVAIPVVLALMISFLLWPVVRLLRTWHIPPPVGAALVLLAVGSVLAYGAYRVAFPAADWIDRMPHTLRRVEYKLRDLKVPIERVTDATDQVEKLAEGDDGERRTTVRLEKTSYSQMLFSQTRVLLVSAALVAILLYFLLAVGGDFAVRLRRAHATGVPEILSSIRHDTSMYLLTITAINSALGVVTGVAMALLGMPNPLLWGVMAACLNFIPYLGAVAGIAIVGIVALVTFDHAGRAIAVPLTYFLLTALEGYLVTPMIVGARLRLNPVAIIIGLMFWSWMWGVTGALLAVPLLVTMKIVCDNVPSLRLAGVLLSR